MYIRCRNINYLVEYLTDEQIFANALFIFLLIILRKMKRIFKYQYNDRVNV